MDIDATAELKPKINLPTGTFLLLTIGTAGFYAYYWMLKYTSLISTAGSKPVASESYLLTMVGLAGWGSALVGGESAGANLLGAGLAIAAWVMVIVWAFKAKDALRAHAATTYGIDYQMNSFYTLIFGYFYINYCINELPEENSRLRSFVQRTATP